MKVKLLVEDRDLAYLFLDTENTEPDAQPVDLKVDGVNLSDFENEDAVVWLMSADGGKLTVVSHERFLSFVVTDETGYPIPSPVIVFDSAEYRRLRDE